MWNFGSKPVSSPFATNMSETKKHSAPTAAGQSAGPAVKGRGAASAREALSTAGYRQNGIVSLPSLGISLRNSTADAP